MQKEENSKISEISNLTSKFDPSFLLNINFIHEVKIFNELQNNKKILIFDLRKKEEYILANLDFSINLPFDQHENHLFDNFNETKLAEMTNSKDLKEMIKKYKRFYIAIVMSEEKVARKKIINLEAEGEEKVQIEKSLMLYKALVKKRVRELGLFNLGFKKFVDHYYFLVRCEDKKPLAR